MGQLDPAKSQFEVASVENADVLEVMPKGGGDLVREDGHAVLAALAFSNRDPVLLEIDVLDTSPRALHEPETCTVEQRSLDPDDAVQVAEHGDHLLPCQHDRESYGVFGAYDVIEPIEALAKHVSVEEQDCGKCLVLSRGAHTALDGQVRKKLRDLGFAHVAGVALPAEEDETTDPPHIRLLCSETKVPRADCGTYLVEEAGCWANGCSGLFDAEGIG